MFSVLVNGLLWLNCQVTSPVMAVCQSNITGAVVDLSADDLAYIQQDADSIEGLDVTVVGMSVVPYEESSIMDELPMIGI